MRGGGGRGGGGGKDRDEAMQLNCQGSDLTRPRNSGTNLLGLFSV